MAFFNSCKSVSNVPCGFCSVSKFRFLSAIRLTDIWECMQKLCGFCSVSKFRFLSAIHLTDIWEFMPKLKRKDIFPGICYYIPLDHNIVYISVILLIL